MFGLFIVTVFFNTSVKNFVTLVTKNCCMNKFYFNSHFCSKTTYQNIWASPKRVYNDICLNKLHFQKSWDSLNILILRTQWFANLKLIFHLRDIWTHWDIELLVTIILIVVYQMTSQKNWNSFWKTWLPPPLDYRGEGISNLLSVLSWWYRGALVSIT